MIQRILNFFKGGKLKCNAIEGDDLCGNEAWGWNGTKSKRYCRKHVPDEATPWPGRTDVDFGQKCPECSWIVHEEGHDVRCSKEY